MSDNNSNVGGILAAFTLGAFAGATVALLYAPRSGRETRDMLAQRACELKDKAKDVIDEAKEMISDKKAEIVAAVEAGKKAIREEHEKHAAKHS